jgi:hypothetical protein
MSSTIPQTLLKEIHQRHSPAKNHTSWWNCIASIIPAPVAKDEGLNSWIEKSDVEVMLVKRASDDGYCVIQPVRSLSRRKA